MSFSTDRAANYTRVAAGASADASISSGGSITVYGFVISNTSSSPQVVTIEEKDGSTAIMTVNMSANSSFESHTKWLAPNGVTITVGANTSCTIFHSNSGS